MNEQGACMREELICIAITKFGARGFDAVGTREIAEAAGTTMSSITYHFGGKEGLYLAAAEHIFAQLDRMVGLADATFPGSASPYDQRLNAVCATLRRLAEFMLSKRSAPLALFIGREQLAPSPPIVRMLREKVLPKLESLAQEVAGLRPDLNLAQAKVITICLFGMSLGVRHQWASMQMLLGHHVAEQGTAEILLNQLDHSVRALLAQPRN